MSRGACIMLGIGFLIGAVGFLSLPLIGPAPASSIAYAAGGFCGLFALALLVPRFRNTGIRMMALVIFAALCVYVWVALGGGFWSGRLGRPSLGRALFAFVFFGLPCAYVAFRGLFPRWLTSRTRFALQKRGIYTTAAQLPADAKIRLEGFEVNPALWRTICTEVQAEKTLASRAWQRRLASVGGAAILIVFLALCVYVRIQPFLGAVIAVGTGIAWMVYWKLPSRRDVKRTRWRFMAKHGLKICVECGYNLTGLPDDAQCPECGWRREAIPAPEPAGHDRSFEPEDH